MASIFDEAYRILDKFDEKVVFYNEQYQDDKYEDAHLKFAKIALDISSQKSQSITLYPAYILNKAIYTLILPIIQTVAYFIQVTTYIISLED